MKTLILMAAAIAMPAGLADAADLPQVKEGLWQIRMQTVENPGNKKSDVTTTLCRNHEYDKSAQALAKNMKGCTSISENLDGSTYSSETRCTVGGTVIDSKGTVSYTDTTAHGETHATYTPAFYGYTDETIIQDQKYVGDCPAGMQPGDHLLPDGTIQHRAKH
jgi:hypothetical protein